MKEFDVDALSQCIIKSGRNEKLGPEIAYFCRMLLGKIKSGQCDVEVEEEVELTEEAKSLRFPKFNNPPIKEKPVDENCIGCPVFYNGHPVVLLGVSVYIDAIILGGCFDCNDPRGLLPQNTFKEKVNRDQLKRIPGFNYGDEI